MLLLSCLFSIAQPYQVSTSLGKRAAQLQQATTAEAAKMSEKMEAKTAKMQKRVAKYEQKLAEICKKTDSLTAVADQITQKADPAYWLQKITAKDSLLAALGTGPYISRLDSLTGMLQFLDNNGNSAAALESIKALKARLGITQEYQQLLDEKLSQWKQLLNMNGLAGKYLPPSFKKLQSEVLTFKAQVAGWKEILNDQQRLEQEALKWLNKLPAFQRFMQQNGELARLFGNGAGGGSATGAAPIAGLQTIQGTQQLMQQRFGNGPQAMQMIQQQLQQGMNQLSQQQQMQDPIAQIKKQTNELLDNAMQGGTLGNSEITPYQQERTNLKAQPLKKRFEFGWDLQTKTRLQGFPAANDLGLSLGYKINPKGVVGIGAAYKFGLGTWQNIQLSHEGLSLRSYVDWRITSPKANIFSNIWVSGGFEMNYWQRFENQPPTNANVRGAPQAWQRSGLIGLSKKMMMGRKEGKIQVLWDFLNPYSARTLPFQIRWGTSF